MNATGIAKDIGMHAGKLGAPSEARLKTARDLTSPMRPRA